MERGWNILLATCFVCAAVGTAAANSYPITIVEDYEHSSDPWPCSVSDLTDDNVKAVIIADTEEQYNNDHLWGQGYVAPDEYPDDDIVWFAEWSC